MNVKDMSPCELAQWMQSEQKTLRELNRIIRQHIASRPDIGLDDWLRGLKVSFERLRVHLERNFAAKEEGGYLRVVTEERPSLSPQVEAIRSEHEEILQLGKWILRDLQEARPEQKFLLRNLCNRVERFIEVVAEHDRREVMITIAACGEDIGGLG